MEKQEYKELVYDAIVAEAGDERARSLSQTAADLRDEMQVRIVEFDFYKKDGTVRHAFGTIDPERLPKTENAGEQKPKKEYTPNWANFRYFDTEKMSWRSFNIVNLISYQKLKTE